MAKGKKETMSTDMHAVFEFVKPFEDIEDAVPIPEDWYLAEICDLPTIEDNRALMTAKAAGGEENDILSVNEKAGKSLRIPLQLLADEPEYCRKIKLNLPAPLPLDLERYNALGQCNYDAKYERIRDFSEAFGADPQGTQLVLEVGMKGYVYVQQMKIGDSGDERIINTIKIFGTGSEKVFKPYTE